MVSAGLEDSPSGKSHILLHRSVLSGSFCGMLGSPPVSFFRNPRGPNVVLWDARGLPLRSFSGMLRVLHRGLSQEFSGSPIVSCLQDIWILITVVS